MKTTKRERQSSRAPELEMKLLPRRLDIGIDGAFGPCYSITLKGQPSDLHIPAHRDSVRRAKVFGHCEVKSGIAPVNRLVGEVMGQEPYKSARRVFWIMDNARVIEGRRPPAAYVTDGPT